MQSVLQMEETALSSKSSPPHKEHKQHPMTPTTLIHFQSPGIQNRASALYDGHELSALANHLSQALTPRWRPSPRTGGSSTLYDSYELKAVAKQLNGALHATHNGMSLYQNRRCLDSLCKKNIKKLKPVAGPHGEHRHLDVSCERKNTGGLLPRMWKKIKRALLRRQQE